MDIVIMDDDFQRLYILDIFESLIWTERYIGFGNFELYTPMNQSIIEIIDFIQEKKKNNLDCYVWSKETDSSMFIEEIQIRTDVENGNYLTISGRGLETILERRIVWETIYFNDENIQNVIETLINNAIISPETYDRAIGNFIFERVDNAYINSIKITMQCDVGSNLYETVLNICEEYQLGFDVYLRSDNKFAFALRYGEDRSFDQNKNPYVIFSPKYDNLINSEYLESGKNLKNVTHIIGDDQWGLQSTLTVGNAIGLSRKEIYTDASDIQFKEYYQPYEDDKQTLNDYNDQFEEQFNTLSRLTSEAQQLSDEHDIKVAEYNQSITGYQNRIICLNQRINDYQSKKDEYVGKLDENQKVSYDLRETYVSEIERLDSLITECDDKIADYEDKLQNEMELTYDKIIQYEDGIKTEEEKKNEYQNERTTNENNKTAEEGKLPKFEELKGYEDMISKYEGIVSNDEKLLKDVQKESEQELLEYNTTMIQYNESISYYMDEIDKTKDLIRNLEDKLVIEEQKLNSLYIEFLSKKGRSTLSENSYMKAFSSEIETKKMFIYGTDFFKGDVVQIVNEYGMEGVVRVSEVVISQDTDGYSVYPTFQVV